MLDIDNASLGFFLWRHVTRMFEVTPLEDVQASNWRIFDEAKPLQLDGYYVDFKNLTEESSRLSSDYLDIVSKYFGVPKNEIKSATLARYNPVDRPTLYDLPDNYQGPSPTVENAFLPVRDYYNKQKPADTGSYLFTRKK